jgi:hypothetical protein
MSLRDFRRACLSALPEPLSKIIRCIGAPNKFIHFPDPTYAQDALVTRHNADFMVEPRFAESYRLGKATGSWPGGEPAWRTYVACWAAQKAVNLEGDFVECGVNRGGMSRAICHYVGFEKLPKLFWLLDTYHGLDEGLINEEERGQGRTAHRDYYTECYGAVQETFKSYPGVRVVQGIIPDTLSQVTAEKVSYLSIDMNCVAPEIAAAEFFWDKLVSGAVMVLDDYGFELHEPQKRAFDAFAEKRGVQVLSMPTGQGLIFKP